MSGSRRELVQQALGLVVGAAVVVALVSYVGLAAVVAAFQRADPTMVLLALTAYAGFFVARGVRWRALLLPVAPKATITSASSLTAFGWLVSTFIPLKAGDVTRTALMARRSDASLAGTAGTVAVERALDVLGIAAAASIGLFIASSSMAEALPPRLGRAVALAWVLPLVGFAGLMVFARFFMDPEEAREDLGKVKRIAVDLVTAADHLRQRPGTLVRVLAWTLFVTVLQAAVFVFLFLAFEPTAPWLLVAAGTPLFLLSFIISVTPGNVGTYEAAFVAVYVLLGFAASTLIPIAVAVHLMTMVIVTILGTAGMLVLRLREPLEPTTSNAEAGE